MSTKNKHPKNKVMVIFTVVISVAMLFVILRWISTGRQKRIFSKNQTLLRGVYDETTKATGDFRSGNTLSSGCDYVNIGIGERRLYCTNEITQIYDNVDKVKSGKIAEILVKSIENDRRIKISVQEAPIPGWNEADIHLPLSVLDTPSLNCRLNLTYQQVRLELTFDISCSGHAQKPYFPLVMSTSR